MIKEKGIRINKNQLQNMGRKWRLRVGGSDIGR